MQYIKTTNITLDALADLARRTKRWLWTPWGNQWFSPKEMEGELLRANDDWHGRKVMHQCRWRLADPSEHLDIFTRRKQQAVQDEKKLASRIKPGWSV